MNARDAHRTNPQILDNWLRGMRYALGWDGTGTPPDIVIMGDGQLKRLEEEIAPEGVIHGSGSVYRLIDPDNMEDRP